MGSRLKGSSESELDRIRDILRQHRKGLTIAEISRILGLNRISTSKYLNMLLAAGQAEMRVHGPSRVFYPSQRVPLSAILNFSSCMMLVMDDSLTITDANPALLAFFSLEKNDVVGQRVEYSPMAGYFSEQTILPNIRLALEGQENTVEVKLEIGCAARFVRIRCIPTVFESGDQGVTLIGEDITELTLYRCHLEQLVEERSRELTDINTRLLRMIDNQKKTRRELRISEKKYRELVENANSIILKIDLDGNITFFNEFARVFFGFSEEEILGKNVLDTIVPLNNSYSRDREKIRKALARYPEYFKSHISENVRKNGERVWISWTNKSIRDAKGNFTGLLAIGNDITEQTQAKEVLEKSEQKLSAIINFLPDATFVIDNDGTVIAWNQAVEKMTGVKSEDMLGKGNYEYSMVFYGKRFPILIDYALDPEKVPSEDYPVTRNGNTLFAEVNSTHLWPGGIYVWATAAPLYDSSGALIGAIESLHDITPAKKAERSSPDRKRNAVPKKRGKQS